MPTLRLQRTHGYWKLVFCLLLLSVFLIPKNAKAQDDKVIDLGDKGWSYANFGKTGADTTEWALQFVPQANHLYCSLTLQIRKQGNPVDSVRVRIYTNGTPPAFGSLITSPPTVLGSSLPSATDEVTNFTFDNCVFLDKYHNFFIRIDRTGSLNNTNYYWLGISTANNYSWAFRWGAVGSSWTQVTQEIAVNIFGFETLSQAGLTEPATSSYNFTDNDFGGLGTYLSDIFKYLFIPNSDALNSFAGLWDTVKAKPPIGYFTTTKTAFDSLQTASGSYYLTFSGLDSGDSPLRPLKLGLVWILWLMLGFWILHRIRQLEI